MFWRIWTNQQRGEGPDGEQLYHEWLASQATKHPLTYNQLARKHRLTFNTVNNRILRYRQSNHIAPLIKLEKVTS